MIRNPRDGTTYELPKTEVGIPTTETTGIIPAIVSGLPISNHKAEYLARLERSRSWLRDYMDQENTEVLSTLERSPETEGFST